MHFIVSHNKALAFFLLSQLQYFKAVKSLCNVHAPAWAFIHYLTTRQLNVSESK